jgi:cbb3-type cytochrome oxidase subunit 3
MSAGICAISLCFGYIFYMNYKTRYDSTNKTYIALNEDNTETIQEKKSKWD